MLKFHIICMKQGIVWGYYVKKFSFFLFFLHSIIIYFLICSYLSHLLLLFKLHQILIVYIYLKFEFLIFEIVRNDEDATANGKIV